MKLGNFSVSLNVADIKKSKDFYLNLGFDLIGGEESQNWLILQNGRCTVGLFQGMFENNIMTFNPGWAADGTALESFTDVRDIQKKLKSKGVEVIDEADETSSGPDSFMVSDPDGNMLLFDQHL